VVFYTTVETNMETGSSKTGRAFRNSPERFRFVTTSATHQGGVNQATV